MSSPTHSFRALEVLGSMLLQCDISKAKIYNKNGKDIGVITIDGLSVSLVNSIGDFPVEFEASKERVFTQAQLKDIIREFTKTCQEKSMTHGQFAVRMEELIYNLGELD